MHILILELMEEIMILFSLKASSNRSTELETD